MTTYTSGKTHHDRRPWLSESSGYRYPFQPEDGLSRYTFAPRPEFDNHNPILEAFRKFHAADPAFDTAEGWLWGIENGHHDPASPEQLAHARRVLTKLAALTTTNGVTD